MYKKYLTQYLLHYNYSNVGDAGYDDKEKITEKRIIH